MRAFGSEIEQRLQKAARGGNYEKKFGFEGFSTKSMDQPFDKGSVGSSSGPQSAFDKLLAKDNRMLNRMQA